METRGVHGELSAAALAGARRPRQLGRRRDANGSGSGSDADRWGAGGAAAFARAGSCSAQLMEARRLTGNRASIGPTLAAAPLTDARRRIEWSEDGGESSREGGARREVLDVPNEPCKVLGLREEDVGGRAATGALLADDSLGRVFWRIVWSVFSRRNESRGLW